ncbi:uncharacterized protein UDID_17229 [Ustilago sp. UG-2017a]|nr:uncharacterized protein UDID_17229 [Ustilago sp. UG-2017a]
MVSGQVSNIFEDLQRAKERWGSVKEGGLLPTVNAASFLTNVMPVIMSIKECPTAKRAFHTAYRDLKRINGVYHPPSSHHLS